MKNYPFGQSPLTNPQQCQRSHAQCPLSTRREPAHSSPRRKPCIRHRAGSLILLMTLSCFACLPARQNRASEDMAAAATKFLASLDAGKQAKATFVFKGDQRSNL